MAGVWLECGVAIFFVFFCLYNSVFFCMSEILIYQTEDDRIEIEVSFEEDTVWLNRQHLSVLFD